MFQSVGFTKLSHKINVEIKTKSSYHMGKWRIWIYVIDYLNCFALFTIVFIYYAYAILFSLLAAIKMNQEF